MLAIGTRVAPRKEITAGRLLTMDVQGKVVDIMMTGLYKNYPLYRIVWDIPGISDQEGVEETTSGWLQDTQFRVV